MKCEEWCMQHIAVPLFSIGSLCAFCGNMHECLFCVIGSSIAIFTSCGIVAAKEYVKIQCEQH